MTAVPDAPAAAPATPAPATPQPQQVATPSLLDEGAALAPTESGETPTPETPPEPQGAPETYEPFTLPEGREIPPGLMDAFTTAVKGANLPQASAQQVLDTLLPALDAQRSQMIDGWRRQAADDPDYGGSQLKANIGISATAYKAITAQVPEFEGVVKQFGLDNNLAFLKGLRWVGTALSEARFVDGSVPSERLDVTKVNVMSAEHMARAAKQFIAGDKAR